jgi:hypothetical protein
MEIAIFLSRAFAAMDAAGHGKVIARPEGGPSADRQGDVPKKLLAFFASDMLQLFEIERFLFDHAIPRDRDRSNAIGKLCDRLRRPSKPLAFVMRPDRAASARPDQMEPFDR